MISSMTSFIFCTLWSSALKVQIQSYINELLEFFVIYYLSFLIRASPSPGSLWKDLTLVTDPAARRGGEGSFWVEYPLLCHGEIGFCSILERQVCALPREGWATSASTEGPGVEIESVSLGVSTRFLCPCFRMLPKALAFAWYPCLDWTLEMSRALWL